MVMVASPKRPELYPDRLTDCECALESGFHDLMRLAFAAGWAPGEISRALLRLIAAERSDEREEAKLVAYLAIARAMEQARQ